MSRRKTQLQIVPQEPSRGGKQRTGDEPGREKPQLVSARWLLTAGCGTVAAAAFCGWLVLCFLFWQGSWQLLYHPAVAVTRTPASVGLSFDPVAFAVNDAGAPRLKGWWIPANLGALPARFTVVYLHGQDGNLGDDVDALAQLHAAGVNVLAFDYRGYGESQFARPSEAHLRQDAEWALEYLTGTRQIDFATIVLYGTGLGANLALEVAAEHPALAGVVMKSPVADPMAAIFTDPRARLVPARLLVRDRYDLRAPADAVRVPVLWFAQADGYGPLSAMQTPDAYQMIAAHKMLVWLNPAKDTNKEAVDALNRWLAELPAR